VTEGENDFDKGEILILFIKKSPAKLAEERLT
jgi:hypothetical protein